jgi:hypothetical protein
MKKAAEKIAERKVLIVGQIAPSAFEHTGDNQYSGIKLIFTKVSEDSVREECANRQWLEADNLLFLTLNMSHTAITDFRTTFKLGNDQVKSTTKKANIDDTIYFIEETTPKREVNGTDLTLTRQYDYYSVETVMYFEAK